MVSIEQTSKKYRGRKAETYEAVRTKQGRWRLENEAVERMLAAMKPTSVLDCPVGTGRFLPLYAKLGIRLVIGVDASEEMLALAQRKLSRRARNCGYLKLVRGDASDLSRSVGMRDPYSVDVTVCVRFLDLIDEQAMRRVMHELMRVTRRSVILTIRLGENYVSKVNTATHDQRAFLRLVGRAGWQVEEMVPIFKQGWQVIRLGRKS
jgi:ubiquinone/menaquinone biosynthesis C-methylase UbiE